LPATLQPDGNLVANWRSLKAMQTCLEGVPMVCSSWLQVCRNSGDQFVLPDSSLYVRSLPTKSHVASDAEYGVAKIACKRGQERNVSNGERYAPFRDAVIYLCGFSCKNEVDFSALARQGGASEVITKPATALARLKVMNSSKNDGCGGKFIILCSESNAIISETFERELQRTCTCSLTSRFGMVVLIVNSSWLFDSISCAEALPPTSFKPYGSKVLRDLWKLCCKQ
jgi:hypothetical protein